MTPPLLPNVELCDSFELPCLVVGSCAEKANMNHDAECGFAPLPPDIAANVYFGSHVGCAWLIWCAWLISLVVNVGLHTTLSHCGGVEKKAVNLSHDLAVNQTGGCVW